MPKPKTLSHPTDRAEKPKQGIGKIHTKQAEAYDPDKEYNEAEVVSSDKRQNLARISVEAVKKGSVNVRGTFAILEYYKDGKLAEATKIPGGKGWKLGFRALKESDNRRPKDALPEVRVRLVRAPTTESFMKLVDSAEWSTSKIMESSGFDPFNYGDNLSGISGPPNDEYIPLMGGPFSKQMYLYDYLDMQAKCFWSKNHDPFAKAIVRLKRAFVVGKGVKLLFKNADCQKSWDDFDKRNSFQEKLRSDVETLVWGGEVMTQKMKDRSGRPSIKQEDPSTCWEIVTDPATPDEPIYFHFQYPTQWQLTYKQGDIGSEYIINDIPADRMIHVKVNVTPGEKRGRSDLYPILSWLKRWRDLMNAKVVKAQMEQSWALDISVDGSPSDVEQIAAANPINRIPPPGSTRVHNKDIEYNVIQPSSSSTAGDGDTANQLKNVIAIGAGIAPEWLGESAAGSTKETARTKEGPASRNIEDLQTVTEGYIRQIADFNMDADRELPTTQVRPSSLSAVKAALLKRDWKAVIMETTALMVGDFIQEPIDKSYEVIFPEPDTDDRTAKISDIMASERSGYISHERAMSMVAKELGITSFDAIDEQQEIQAEQDLGAGNPEWGNGVNSAAALKDGLEPATKKTAAK